MALTDTTTSLGENLRDPEPRLGKADNYVPLKDRFAAWWNGAGTERPDSRPTPREQIAANVENREPEPPLSPARIAAIEQIWGEGFLLPGGEKFARKLLAVLALSSKKSVLDLTADIGGTARALSTQHNLWMDAFEPQEELSIEGHRRSLAAGLGKRVPIKHVDFETLELTPRRYDAIYSRERLFTIANKDRLFDQCVIGLKDRGQIVISDLVVPEPGGAAGTDISLRRNGEAPHFWTVEQYRAALARRGLQVYLAQDMTEEYLNHIHAAWSKAPKAIRREKMSHRQVDLVVDEGEIWLARLRAFRAGDLHFVRFHAQLGKAD